MHVLLAIVMALASASAHAGGPVSIVTPRGAKVEIIADKPTGSGPFPAVILASGASADMRQPIIQRTAQALLNRGIAVYRFDWAYRVAGQQYAAQPKDRLAQIEDMQAVLAFARRDADIDGARIAVAGKSLGSVVAWQVLRGTPELKGAILLTPVCTQPAPDAAATNYPGLAAEERPHLWIVGDIDPICPVPVFYRFIAAAGSDDHVAVISGNHGYQSPTHPERDQRAFDLMLGLTTDFAETLLASVHGAP